jgi:hypothetical protein
MDGKRFASGKSVGLPANCAFFIIKKDPEQMALPRVFGFIEKTFLNSLAISEGF